MNSCTYFLGYSKELSPSFESFSSNQKHLVCRVIQVIPDTYRDFLPVASGKYFSIGDWCVITGALHTFKIHDFFKSSDDAFDYASEHLGAISFRTPTESFK